MDSSVFSTVLPVVVAIVMLGLGLALTLDDFRRTALRRRAVLVVLICQIVVLPGLGMAAVGLLGIPDPIALGVVVLLASPGGAMAAVFSHLADGDVALNITTTAANAVLSLVTMPLIIGLGVRLFGVAGRRGVVVPPDKVIQLVLVILGPAALGMLIRRHRPDLALRAQRPLRTISIVVVFISIVAAVGPQAAGFVRGLAAVGALVLALCLLAMAVGLRRPATAAPGPAPGSRLFDGDRDTQRGTRHHDLRLGARGPSRSCRPGHVRRPDVPPSRSLHLVRVTPTGRRSGQHGKLVAAPDVTSRPVRRGVPKAISRSFLAITGPTDKAPLPSIADGEYSCVFISGELTNSVLKRAADGEFRVEAKYGGRTTVTTPPAEVQAAATRAVQLPDPTTSTPASTPPSAH